MPRVNIDDEGFGVVGRNKASNNSYIDAMRTRDKEQKFADEEAMKEAARLAEEEVNAIRKGVRKFYGKTVFAPSSQYPEWHPARNPNSLYHRLADPMTMQKQVQPLLKPLPQRLRPEDLHEPEAPVPDDFMDVLALADLDDLPRGSSAPWTRGSRPASQGSNRVVAIANFAESMGPEEPITVTNPDEPIHSASLCVRQSNNGAPSSLAAALGQRDAVARFLNNTCAEHLTKAAGLHRSTASIGNPTIWTPVQMQRWAKTSNTQRRTSWEDAREVQVEQRPLPKSESWQKVKLREVLALRPDR